MKNIEQLSEVINKLKIEPLENENYFCLAYDNETSIGLMQGKPSEIIVLLCCAMDKDEDFKNILYKAVHIHLNHSTN